MDKRYDQLQAQLRGKGYEGEELTRITNKICREMETLGFKAPANHSETPNSSNSPEIPEG